MYMHHVYTYLSLSLSMYIYIYIYNTYKKHGLELPLQPGALLQQAAEGRGARPGRYRASIICIHTIINGTNQLFRKPPLLGPSLSCAK